MRATLEEIKTEISALEPEIPIRIESGEIVRDKHLVVDGSSCSAIAHLYSLHPQGNTLVVRTRHDGTHVIKPLQDASVVAGAVIDFIRRVEGNVSDE